MYKDGFPIENKGLSKNTVSIASAVSQAGYKTAFFGKWHPKPASAPMQYAPIKADDIVIIVRFIGLSWSACSMADFAEGSIPCFAPSETFVSCQISLTPAGQTNSTGGEPAVRPGRPLSF